MKEITPAVMSIGFLGDTLEEINQAIDQLPGSKKEQDRVRTFLAYGLEDAEQKIASVLVRESIQEALDSLEQMELLNILPNKKNQKTIQMLEELQKIMVFGDM